MTVFLRCQAKSIVGLVLNLRNSEKFKTGRSRNIYLKRHEEQFKLFIYFKLLGTIKRHLHVGTPYLSKRSLSENTHCCKTNRAEELTT